MASSSSSHPWKYDVFLSFRGSDTRTGFTNNLYEALRKENFETFMDGHKLKKGARIASLLQAVKDSRIAVVICSENYGESSWCLDELVQIFQCEKSNQQIVMPLFYKVTPSDVRHRTGTFGTVFKENKGHEERIPEWNAALDELADSSGWVFPDGNKYESQIIKEIVEEVSRYYPNKNKDLVGQPPIYSSPPPPSSRPISPPSQPPRTISSPPIFPPVKTNKQNQPPIYSPPSLPSRTISSPPIFPPVKTNKQNNFNPNGTSSDDAWTHDVFFSFKGERSGFQQNLYNALQKAGIKTFMDDYKVPKKEASESLIQAVLKASKAFVIMFDLETASSSWCLNELVKILQCSKRNNQIVVPVFNKVEPGDVENQTGQFGSQMSILLRAKDCRDSAPGWKAALREVSKLPGFSYKKGSQYTKIEEIVKFISGQLQKLEKDDAALDTDNFRYSSTLPPPKENRNRSNTRNSIPLDNLKRICPPDGESRTVLYTMGNHHKESIAVRKAMKQSRLEFKERDLVVQKEKFKDPLFQLFSDNMEMKPSLPCLFVKGRYLDSDTLIELLNQGTFAEAIQGLIENGDGQKSNNINADTFKQISPPDREDKVVLYATRNDTDSIEVRKALKSSNVIFEWRDITSYRKFERELHLLVKHTGEEASIPSLFVKGRFLNADTIKDRLNKGTFAKVIQELIENVDG